MALAYRQPGVTVEEEVSPTISPLLAAPGLLCLVGPSQGYQTRTDQFVLSGTTPVALPGLPAGATVQAVLSVKDALDPTNGAADGSGYVLTTDYTVSTANGTITRVGAGGIADNTLVVVTYTYIPENYFTPIRLYDQGSVESRFGSSLNSTGTAINSPLSYAAGIAFENGASSVVCLPLFARDTPGDPDTAASQPDATETAALATWQDTLFVLRDIEDINIIVPVIGQSTPNVGDATQVSLFGAIQDHIYFMANQDQYIVAVLGEDSSASNTVAQKATIRSHAATLRSRYNGVVAEQTVLLNISKLTRALPSAIGTKLTLGAQYAAAAVGGMLASRPVSSTLTRQAIAGFLEINDYRDLDDKNTDGATGLFVLEQKGYNIFVRHGVTLDNSNSAKRELSVVRAKHRTVESVRDTLDRQIVGQIVADGNATSIVRTTVIGVLEQLRVQRDIIDYSGVEARFTSLDPTTIQVRFSYRPAFPVNYINVVFSLDLSAGLIEATI